MPKKRERGNIMNTLLSWWDSIYEWLFPAPYTWYEECLIFVKVHQMEINIGMAISFLAMMALAIFALRSRKKVMKTIAQEV